jgi:hypothetical protein
MIYPNKYMIIGEKNLRNTTTLSAVVASATIGAGLNSISTPKSETPNLEENSSHLVKINDLVYMIEIISKLNSCIRVRFLETVPPKFNTNSSNGEAWVHISDLYFLEKLDKNTLRTIKINSIVSDNE